MEFNKQTLIVFGIILVLSLTTMFFAVHNYRNELIIAQAAQLQQMQGILQQTNVVLNQVNWTNEAIETWRSLGYHIEPKLPK